MKRIDVQIGSHIASACEAAAEEARSSGDQVCFDFNGTEVVVNPGEDPSVPHQRWQDEMNRKQAEYEASPAGIEAKRKAEERDRMIREENSKPLPTFGLKDEAAWKSCIEKNSDGYGSGVIRYVARWAALMEERLVNGETVAGIAKKSFT